uniref:hypothetical protein n=1 Tax=Polaribacter sp. TaxID=1920175 RepID=UPI0040474551
MLITIIAAIVIAAVLAFFIVKYLPLKLKPMVSIILLVLAGFLTWKIYDGVMKPINFNKEKKVIYTRVINQLKMIRDAQIAHKDVTGQYTKDMDGLIKFIDTAKRAITQTVNVVEKVNKGTKWQPIMVDVDKRVTDTIGYEPVISRFVGRDYKNMFNVPGTNEKFTIELGSVEKVQGLIVPAFEAKVAKDIILKGMDASLIKVEKEVLSTDEIRGAYVSVGSLTEVSTGGNWPPSYDNKGERAANKD